MTKTPDINLSQCNCCRGCEELCPGVFRLNPAGYMEVIYLAEYPENLVNEAINDCPEDCVTWAETE
ncbi:MAG: ferredoxin [Pseudomonadota bacterium]